MKAPWSDALLDEMREIGDPLADSLIAQAYKSGGKQSVAQINRHLQHWNEPIPKDFPADIREFFEAPVKYPGWVDMDQIRLAQEVFYRCGIETMLVLVLKSLGQYFADAKAAHVFARTDFLNPGTIGRFVVEVIQVIFDVVRPGGLDLSPVKAGGVLALQKLRLHHSVVRFQVTVEPVYPLPAGREFVPWDPGWGKPINQEDLAAAGMAFSLWTLEGMGKLGEQYTVAEKEAVLMIWKTIDFLLGLDERLQPDGLIQGHLLLETVGKRQFCPSESGTMLARKLLAAFEHFLPRGLRSIPLSLMRFLMDSFFVELLKIPKVRPGFSTLVGAFVRKRLEDHGKHCTERLSSHFVKWLMSTRDRHGERGRFRIPKEVSARF